MTRYALPLSATAVLIAYGLAEGVWFGRWSPSTKPAEFAARLADVPKNLGDWEGTDHELEAREMKIGRLTGALHRHYQRRTGESVTVLLVCGRAGPISVHTPDVCFQGLGFSLAGEPTRRKVEPAASEFWSGRFEKPGGTAPETLAIRWGWTSAGEWSAPKNARVEFAGREALYKLYVIRSLPPAAAKEKADPVEGFLELFLPAARAALFPAT